MRGSLKDFSIGGLFFVFLGIYLLMGSLGASLGIMASMPLVGSNDLEVVQETLFEPSDEDLRDRGVLFAVKLVNILSHLAKLLGAVFFIYLIGEHPLRNMGYKQQPAVVGLLLGALAVVLSGPMITLLQEWNMSINFPAAFADYATTLEEQAAMYSQAMIQRAPAGDMLTTFLLVAVLAAVWEEVVFRGIFQRIFQMGFGNGHVAVWLAAIMFSAIHFQFFTFIPRMMLGVILGYLYLYSRQLWVPIVAHAINNGGLLIYAWVTLKDPTEVTSQPSILLSLGSFLVVSAILYGVYRFYRGKGLGADIQYRQESSG